MPLERLAADASPIITAAAATQDIATVHLTRSILTLLQRLFYTTLTVIENRIDELNLLIQKIYEDKTFGRITEAIYSGMYANMSNELNSLQEEQKLLENSVNEHFACEKSINDFMDLLEQYAPVKKLDAVLLNNLIEKIVVHERQRIDSETIMPIEIYYRFVGKVENMPENMLLTGRLARTKDF